MIRLLALAVVLAFALVGTAALPASAAPNNKNTVSFTVNCEDIGEITVTENDQGEEPLVFGPDGQVFVGKAFSFTSDVSVAISGGPTITFADTGTEGSTDGKGYEERLVSCEGGGEFLDSFTVDEGTIAFLEGVLAGQGNPAELDAFLGAEATATGTFAFTVLALMPGK